jgi:hypothetical protein
VATWQAEHADDGALPDSRDGWRELLLGAIDDDAEEEEEEEVWLPPRTGLPRGSRTRSKSPPGTAYRREMTVFAETQRRSTEHSKSPSRKVSGLCTVPAGEPRSACTTYARIPTSCSRVECGELVVVAAPPLSNPPYTCPQAVWMDIRGGGNFPLNHPARSMWVHEGARGWLRD